MKPDLQFWVKLLFTMASVSFINMASAQIPGQSYLDNTGYVEYIHGNSPVIISIPHGGLLEPDAIPDRSCNGCIFKNDTYTQEMGRAIADVYHQQTGYYPFVIINLLARVKFDANRSIEDAADGNPTVETAWGNYHAYLESASSIIVQDFGRGLFLDLHGHNHEVERVELGYTLTGAELRLSDATLNTNTYIGRNSIKTLISDNQNSFSHIELLRGETSFGALLHEKGHPTVPSPADPAPNKGEDYFNGGYNTWMHGSRLNGQEMDGIQIEPNIDGIQIEVNHDVRFDEMERILFAEACATSVKQYLSVHYGVGVIDFDEDGAMSDMDCDDFNPNINPDAEEIPYNGIDDDCNPDTPDDDLDQDGFNNVNDCDDNNSNINPNAEEVPYNGIDDDCNPDTLDDDLDQDGFDNLDDCDDTNADINPDTIEIPDNGIDDDCNPNTFDNDLDGDGFNNVDDCDDNNPNINPDAEEIPYNGIDDDCDPATLDDDLDQDGFDNADDCDDTNPNINPGAEEVPYNGIDDDCNPVTLDDDLDEDGFNNSDDCNDNNANINPNAEEIPYNGMDDDCNPATLDDDLDGDGFNHVDDCNDNNANINPNAEEVPYNGIDNDCNPATLDDDLDQDGFNNVDDCDDSNSDINPDAEEISDNQVDENCDGIIEVTSSSEAEPATEPEPEPEPQQKNINELVIYPNPTSDYIHIEKPDNHHFKIEIFDMNQRLVLSEQGQYTLNLAHLSNGMYFLVYEDLVTGKKTVKKWIIAK